MSDEIFYSTAAEIHQYSMDFKK